MSNMQESAKDMLNTLVEEQLISLLREASCIQRHVKRARIVDVPATDIDGGGVANNANNVDADSRTNQPRQRILKRIGAQDINLALQWRGSPKLFTTNGGSPFASMMMSSLGDGGNNSAVTQDRSSTRVDLNQYVNSEMQTRAPSEIKLSMHWLAIDGVQPSIPQNVSLIHPLNNNHNGNNRHIVPPDSDDNRNNAQVEQDDEYDNDNEESTSGILSHPLNKGPGMIEVRQLLPRLLPYELKNYFTEVITKLTPNKNNRLNKITASSSSKENNNGDVVSANSNDDESLMYQFYRDQDKTIQGVASDTGLQELVPVFSQFIADEIKHKLGYVDYCRTMIRLADALISNPHLNLQLHLHQLIGPILTCVIARKLSFSPNENHWILREEAARTLVKICAKFGSQYMSLRANVLGRLCEAIGQDKPLTTQYGGMIGITLFGIKAIDAFLIPVARPYWEKYQHWESVHAASSTTSSSLSEHSKNNSSSSSRDLPDLFEIQQCQQAMLSAVGIYMRNPSYYESRINGNQFDSNYFSEAFGEYLVPYQMIHSEYFTYFI